MITILVHIKSVRTLKYFLKKFSSQEMQIFLDLFYLTLFRITLIFKCQDVREQK